MSDFRCWNDLAQYQVVKRCKQPICVVLRGVIRRSLLVNNPSGVEMSSVPRMTNLRQLKLTLSTDTISLHVLEHLHRLPHLRDLQINLVCAGLSCHSTTDLRVEVQG